MTELAELVRAVANAMGARGETWELVTGQAKRGFGVDMRNGDGEIVSFQVSKQPGRLVIEGIDPLVHYTAGRVITVAASRGPLAIASDIAVKVLPLYRGTLAARRERESKDRAAFEGRTTAVNEAEKLFGQHSDFGAYDPKAAGEVTYRASARLALRNGPEQDGSRACREFAFGRVSATVDGSLMSLEISGIPRDVVMRMLAVLAGHNASV